MEAASRLGAGAERIESMEWLRDFSERYLAAWNSHDPAAVAACMSEDVSFEDPALAEPAQGPDEVMTFATGSFTAFPDFQVSETGALAISDDGLVSYAPFRMIGTNSGPIDPPGFAPTGKSFAVEGVSVWRFRGGLIWRYREVYDSTEMVRQLGLMPSPGSRAERALVRTQRLRSKLPF